MKNSEDGTAAILVGVDFSDGSASAARLAGRLSRQLGARVALLHVADSAPWGWHSARLDWMAAIGMPREALVVRSGVPWIELARHSQQIGALMLVVGSHGCSGYQPVAPGSTTVMLLSRADRPVLVAPPAS